MTVLFLTIGLIAFFFIMMSVRLLLLKKGEFKGTCASQNPYLNKEGATCGFCGKEVSKDMACANPDSEVNKVLEKFK